MKRFSLCILSVLLVACHNNQAPQTNQEQQKDSTELLSAVVDSVEADTLSYSDPDQKAVCYTPKQLKALMDTLNRKFSKSASAIRGLHGNVYAYGIYDSHIVVNLCLNTPQARALFRKYISDSPVIRFEGPSEPEFDNRFFPSDTLSVSLKSQQAIYAATDTFATFVLQNNSKQPIECGDSYSITFEDEHGHWRRLPMNPTFNSIAYLIDSGGNHEVKAHLNPDLLPNKPGRYRFFFSFSFNSNSKGIMLMTEFRLE